MIVAGYSDAIDGGAYARPLKPCVMAIADAIHRGVTEHVFEAGDSASDDSPRCAVGLPSRADADAAFGRHGRAQKHFHSELSAVKAFFRVIPRPAIRTAIGFSGRA